MNHVINLINNFFQIKNYLKIKSKNNIDIKSKLKESKIVIEGLNNLIKIEKSNLKRLKIGIYGKNNILEIHNNCLIRDLNIIIQGNNLKLIINENCDIGGAHIVCAGDNSSIKIGKNCLLAAGIEIRNNDGHTILQDDQVINKSKDILIEENIWICQNVKILKGADIGANSVIALNALVLDGKYDKNVILAGIPAKVIKRGISWSKEMPD